MKVDTQGFVFLFRLSPEILAPCDVAFSQSLMVLLISYIQTKVQVRREEKLCLQSKGDMLSHTWPADSEIWLLFL